MALIFWLTRLFSVHDSDIRVNQNVFVRDSYTYINVCAYWIERLSKPHLHILRFLLVTGLHVGATSSQARSKLFNLPLTVHPSHTPINVQTCSLCSPYCWQAGSWHSTEMRSSLHYIFEWFGSLDITNVGAAPWTNCDQCR